MTTITPMRFSALPAPQAPRFAAAPTTHTAAPQQVTFAANKKSGSFGLTGQIGALLGIFCTIGGLLFFTGKQAKQGGALSNQTIEIVEHYEQSGRDSGQLVSDLKKWILDETNPTYPYRSWNNHMKQELVTALINSPKAKHSAAEIRKAFEKVDKALTKSE